MSDALISALEAAVGDDPDGGPRLGIAVEHIGGDESQQRQPEVAGHGQHRLPDPVGPDVAEGQADRGIRPGALSP